MLHMYLPNYYLRELSRPIQAFSVDPKSISKPVSYILQPRYKSQRCT